MSAPSIKQPITQPVKPALVEECPPMEYVEYFGYFILGIIVPIFLWVILYKLNGGTIILKLPFNYQMGGIKNIYSYKYLNIGE